jgi:hypothetical protein
LLELTLDGNKLTMDDVGCWGDALECLEAEHIDEGRIIRTIAFDGHELEDFRSPALASQSVEELERVDVVSVDWKEYLDGMVTGAPKHLGQVGLVVADSIRFYRQNLPREGARRLQTALAGLDVLFQLVASARALGGLPLDLLESPSDSPESSGPCESSSEPRIAALGRVLEEVVGCQQNRDDARLATVLELEFLPELAKWSALFETWIERREPSDHAVAPTGAA